MACVGPGRISTIPASPRPVWGELNFPNFDRASSTARCNLYRGPRPSHHPPSRFPHVHAPPPRGGVAAPLVPHGNISAGRARRFRGGFRGSNVYIVRGERRTCGEVVREVTMLPPPLARVIRRCCSRKFESSIVMSSSLASYPDAKNTDALVGEPAGNDPWLINGDVTGDTRSSRSSLTEDPPSRRVPPDRILWSS